MAGVNPADGGAFAKDRADDGGEGSFARRFLNRDDFFGGQIVHSKVLHHLNADVELGAVRADDPVHAFASEGCLFQRGQYGCIGKFVVILVELLAADRHAAGAMIGKSDD